MAQTLFPQLANGNSPIDLAAPEHRPVRKGRKGRGEGPLHASSPVLKVTRSCHVQRLVPTVGTYLLKLLAYHDTARALRSLLPLGLGCPSWLSFTKHYRIGLRPARVPSSSIQRACDSDDSQMPAVGCPACHLSTLHPPRQRWELLPSHKRKGKRDEVEKKEKEKKSTKTSKEWWRADVAGHDCTPHRTAPGSGQHRLPQRGQHHPPGVKPPLFPSI